MVGLAYGACVVATQLPVGPALAQEPEVTSPADSSVSVGFFTRGQASRGERRFQQLCEACHRTNEITRGWFGGILYQTAGDLLNTISMTMPDGNPGSLSPEEYVEILAFLLRLNDYPTGEEELPADLSQLERIGIPEP